ncbi:MAG: tRNA uridine-5-carboxymethylaminomethyl(34) synthesis GTPase MnmE [Pseudomonadota bacterium]
MVLTRDTICALASGPPPAAICVLRVSGPAVSEVISKCLSEQTLEDRRATLVDVNAPNGLLIDSGLAIFMAGPRSYTGEDTLELFLHGGRVITEMVLQTLIASGARLAEPGEFTRRAFESGKFDLTQAEAVADLIDAESEAQLRQALTQMGGALARLYSDWRAQLTSILALLEASIDFPDEEDAPDWVDSPVLDQLSILETALREALKDGNITERIRDGFKIAILGEPNAGKSTLLNQLAKREAAIVTDIPGTTRDIVEVRRVLGGQLVWIADTAGLRETADPIEAEGVRRARQAGAESDLRIWVYDADASDAPTEVRPGDIVVANKADLLPTGNVSRETLAVSAKTGAGVAELETLISDRLAEKTERVSAPMITRARHRQGIEKALHHLAAARAQVENGRGAEFAAEDVRLAARALGTLTGHIDSESVLGAVFSSFCIGK